MQRFVYLIVFLISAPALGWASLAGAQAFSHQRLDDALRAHVRNGHVDYAGLAGDPNLHDYVKRIASADTTALVDPHEKLVFWINAYNALAIKGILNGGSPSSFFGRIGYFSGSTYDVGGRTVNLYDLERKIIMPMGEPRIHFAINCASLSCPVLRSGSYEVKQLAAQLDEAATGFINDPSKNRFDRAAKIAHLSKIFDWYDGDFGGQDAAVLRYISRYVADPELAAALVDGTWKIAYLNYDWSLNGTPPPG